MENTNLSFKTIQSFSLDFIQTSYKIKPKTLFIPEVKWKLIIRNFLKGKNTLIVGHTGTAKTLLCKTAAEVLERPFFKFNMGAMQDPRASLIGNTFFDSKTGTYFNEAEFIKAIQTENAIICLDEITRAHPDANNILLSVTEPKGGFLRLDEKDGQDIIYVANGVCFVATANIGNEYTGTRQLDRATLDRFASTIEMEMLDEKDELELLKLKFPDVEEELLILLTSVSFAIREEFNNEGGNISTMMSTRMAEEAAELLLDGFTIAEALDVTLLPLYDNQGGASSERQTVKTIIDSIIPKGDELNKNLFSSGISAGNPFAGNLK